MSLKKLLYADLQRQYYVDGLYNKNSGLMGLLVRSFSPRFFPVLIYRLAHAAFLLRIPLLPKILSLINFFMFGLEISARCSIGGGLFFPHTQGTVIGAWSIGNNATIFQGVTLGAKSLDMQYLKQFRPILHDNVVVGAGAKVLGGVILGSNSCVGANAVVLKDVPERALAVGVPAINKVS